MKRGKHSDSIEAREDAFLPYRAELRRFLRIKSGCDQTAEDLAQEVYLRLLRFASAEVAESPQAYIYRVASNVMNDWLLRRRRDRITFNSEVADAVDPLDAGQVALDASETLHVQQELHRLMSDLPAAQQTALIMMKRDGRSYEEIAKALGVSERTVKRLIARAIATCRANRDASRRKPFP